MQHAAAYAAAAASCSCLTHRSRSYSCQSIIMMLPVTHRGGGGRGAEGLASQVEGREAAKGLRVRAAR